MPWEIKQRDGKYCVYKKGESSPIACHATREKATKHLRALYANEPKAQVAASSAAIIELQNNGPLLTTLPNVSIVKTGIEYPLSTGLRTFTPEDLRHAVQSQDDPAIPAPRIWIGHPDDSRIHGDRSMGHPSGEPALGKVTNMRLEQDGHKIAGDLSGIPIWLARIMASAFPSRSIEGKSNWKTPTGNKWDFVINELALLGVIWPGVNTIEDIATLYTEEGPEQLAIIEASEDAPVTVTPKLQRPVAAGVTVEDLRRQLYSHIRSDPKKRRWWLRSIFASPQEVVVDDEEGGIHSLNWSVENGQVKFGPLQRKRVEYVNASDGGIRPTTVINEGAAFIAQFDSAAEVEPNEDSITINLTGGNK